MQFDKDFLQKTQIYFSQLDERIEELEKQLKSKVKQDNTNEVLSVSDAMKMFNYTSRNYFLRLIKIEGIPHVKCGLKITFFKNDLELFLKKKKGEILNYWDSERLQNLVTKAKKGGKQ